MTQLMKLLIWSGLMTIAILPLTVMSVGIVVIAAKDWVLNRCRGGTSE